MHPHPTHTLQAAAAAARASDPLALFFDPWWAVSSLPSRDLALPATPSIKLDVKEDATNFEVHAELPGFAKDEIKVELGADHTLHISAAHSTEKKEEDGTRWHRVERSSASVYRSLKLPTNVNPAAVAASSKDGVLTVVVPKIAPDATTRRSIAVA